MMNTIETKIIIICISLTFMGLLITAPSYGKIDPETVVGAWLFDEGGGKTAKDSSGNGNNGDVIGDAKWVAGQSGKALELNGTNAWVHVPKIGTFDEVTIAEWVNMTGRVGQWRVIFNNDGWKAGDVHHQLYGNNVIGFSLHSNPGGNDIKSNFMLDAGQVKKWHHLATAYSSKEKKIRFYVDGKLDVERQWGGNPAVLGPARIGSWDGGGREWQGIFDEFIILNVALNDEGDVKSLMNDGIGRSIEPAGKIATIWGKIREVRMGKASSADASHPQWLSTYRRVFHRTGGFINEPVRLSAPSPQITNDDHRKTVCHTPAEKKISIARILETEFLPKTRFLVP